MNLHEQARAEAERRTRAPGISGQTLPSMEQVAEQEGYRRGFVHGAEWAATRTRVVTTVTELDALPIGSVALDRHGAAWQKDRSGVWYPATAALARCSADLPLPARVLYDPEEDR